MQKSYISGSPVNLPNIVEKEEQFFVNETSSVREANSSDVTFQRKAPTETDDINSNYSTAKYVTLKEIRTLSRNQKVSVSEILTISDNPPKEVVKRNGAKGLAKEDCTIQDSTGHTEKKYWGGLDRQSSE